MNTALHIVMNLSVGYRLKNDPPVLPVIAGAILPDAAMLFFFPWYKLQGFSENYIWSQLFFDPGWQYVFAIFNSMPLTLLLLVGAWWVRQEGWAYFLGSMLLHQFVDFFTHSKDAHMHLWPLSEFRFYSPISYWNPDDFGFWITSLEVLLFILATRAYWKSFGDWRPKAAWGVMATLYLVSLLEYLSWMYNLVPPMQ